VSEAHASDYLSKTHEIHSFNAYLAEVQGSNSLVLRYRQKEISIALAPLLVGRDPSCTLSLALPTISRYHAVIYRFGRNYIVRDLHSTNGVFLNQVQVYQAPIRPGDHLRFGDQEFEVLAGPSSGQTYASECAVLFMDVANSTALTEQYGEAFSQYLHAEISRLEDRIFWNLGCPVKHLGDGLMSVFGLWPPPSDRYYLADKALESAYLAVQHIRNLNRFPGLRLRVGMAYGEVSVIEQESLDFFGDTVNLAARLEFSNKLYGTEIMMSESFYRMLNNREGLREIDTVRVQGKQLPVNIYTLDENVLQSNNHAYIDLYHMALNFYRQGLFKEALECLKQPPVDGDAPSQQLKVRIMKILAGQIETPTTWDGVWNIDKE
jgi:class 3 adenylate cyclase